MPIIKMQCPKCKHKYLLPKKEADIGFKRCPKCGYKSGNESAK